MEVAGEQWRDIGLATFQLGVGLLPGLAQTVERINFGANQLGNTSHPGVQAMVQRLGSNGATLSPESLVDGCLDMMGGYQLLEGTRRLLVDHVQEDGELNSSSGDFATRVGQMLQLIAATQEYQLS